VNKNASSCLTSSARCEFHAIIQLVWDGFYVVYIQRLFSQFNNWKSTCPIDLKFSGKMHFHKKMIRLNFGCKRLSVLKVIAPYSTTTEPKLARCQPRAQTISRMRWEQVRLFDSKIINWQSSW